MMAGRRAARHSCPYWRTGPGQGLPLAAFVEIQSTSTSGSKMPRRTEYFPPDILVPKQEYRSRKAPFFAVRLKTQKKHDNFLFFVVYGIPGQRCGALPGECQGGCAAHGATRRADPDHPAEARDERVLRFARALLAAGSVRASCARVAPVSPAAGADGWRGRARAA